MSETWTVALTDATWSTLMPTRVSRKGKAVMVKPATSPKGVMASPMTQPGGRKPAG